MDYITTFRPQGRIRDYCSGSIYNSFESSRRLPEPMELIQTAPLLSGKLSGPRQ